MNGTPLRVSAAEAAIIATMAVDQPAGQRFFLGRSPLALEEAARDAPGGGEFFLVVDGQREEVLPRLHALRSGHRAKHHSFAESRENRAVGLPRNAARFELQRLPAPLDFNLSHIVEHCVSFTPMAVCRWGQLVADKPVCERFGAFECP
jgi:hypothetical protein